MASELLFRTMEQNKIETDKKTLTIFTPTYNRAYTLHLGYEALSRQTCKDFIWLIVDDGSTDDTLEWVEKWIAERKIDIRYHYQENQGMHAAHNTAYRLIDTELNTCVDSDDYMPDDAVEKIITFWNAHGSKEVAGIIGLDADFQGNLIGTPFPYECRRTYFRRILCTRRAGRQKTRCIARMSSNNIPNIPFLKERNMYHSVINTN